MHLSNFSPFFAKFLRIALATYSAFAISILSSCPGALASPKDGEALRTFLVEMIKINSEAKPENQAAAIRTCFAQHPEILNWAMQNRDAKELLSDAGLPQFQFAIDNLTPGQSQTQTLMTRIFGKWLTRYGVATENTRQLESLHTSILQDQNLQSILEKAVKESNTESRISALNLLGDQPFLEFSKNLDQTLSEVPLSQSPLLKAFTNPSTGMDIQGVPQEMKQMFSAALGEYFDALPLENKRRIFYEILTLPPNLSPEKNISVLLQNSGPALQKMFQLFGKDTSNTELRAVLEELKANVKPIEPELLKPIIAKQLGRPFDEVFLSLDPKPLGAGTIGQAHLATLRSGQKVVLKIRRPGVIEEAHRELEVFRKIAHGNRAQEEVVRRLEESILEEMNFLSEAKNTHRGLRYQDPSHGLNAVKLSRGIQQNEGLLVLDFAPGKPLNQLKDREIIQRGKALENLMARWVDESIFETGFFHGDLHAANLLYQRRPGKEPPFQLSIIDFGSADTLTLRQRRAFAQLIGGVVFHEESNILEGMREVAYFSEESLRKFNAQLKNIDLLTFPLSERINQILNLALNCGAQIPASLLKYNRGRMFLEGQLEEVNQRLNIIDPLKKKPRFNPLPIYLKVGAKGAARDLSRQIFRLEKANRAVITPQLVMDLFSAKARLAWRTAIIGCQERYKLIMQSDSKEPKP